MTAEVVEFALLERGAWRATVDGCTLDVWPVGGGWRWTVTGRDGVYCATAEAPTFEDAATAARAAVPAGR